MLGRVCRLLRPRGLTPRRRACFCCFSRLLLLLAIFTLKSSCPPSFKFIVTTARFRNTGHCRET